MRTLLPLLFLLGCADRVAIEDGQRLNGVIQLQDWFTSFFARPTDEGVVLVDAGFRADQASQAMNAQGLDLQDVRHVFLTHGHGDHLGLLPELPNATVHALPAEVDLVAEESEATVTSELADGQVVQVGVNVEVFAVPGHTPGSAAFLIDGVLLLGDNAIVNRHGVLVPVDEDRSDDPELLVQSVQQLATRLSNRAHEIDWLAPAHSAPLQGFDALSRFPEE